MRGLPVRRRGPPVPPAPGGRGRSPARAMAAGDDDPRAQQGEKLDRDPEREPRGERPQLAARPDGGPRGGRGDELVGESELAAEFDRRQVAGEEDVRPRVERAVAELCGSHLAADAIGRLRPGRRRGRRRGLRAATSPLTPAPATRTRFRAIGKPCRRVRVGRAAQGRPPRRDGRAVPRAPGRRSSEAVRAKASPSSAARSRRGDVEVIAELEVVGGEAGGADDDGPGPLAGGGGEEVENVGAEPRPRRSGRRSAIPSASAGDGSARRRASPSRRVRRGSGPPPRQTGLAGCAP